MHQDPASFVDRSVQVTSPLGSGTRPLHVAVAHIAEATGIDPDAIEDSLLTGSILVVGDTEYAIPEEVQHTADAIDWLSAVRRYGLDEANRLFPESA